MKCQCESSVCGGHGNGPCDNTATQQVPTIYGKYLMCRKCAEALPADFKKTCDDFTSRYKSNVSAANKLQAGLKSSKVPPEVAQLRADITMRRKALNAGKVPAKYEEEARQELTKLAAKLKALNAGANDEIQPVGSEDPERDAALAAHESGETEAQDRRKAKDVSSRSDPWLAMVKRQYNDKIYTSVRNTFKASGKEAAANYLQKFTTRKVEGATAQPPTRGEDVLPVPIKTSNAVPMPTENDGAQRYATDRWRGKDKMPPMRAKDTDPRKPLYVQGEWKVMPTHDPDKVQVLRGTQLVNEVEDLEAAKRFIAGKAKTADAELKNTSTQDIKMEILALEDKEKLSNVQAARLKMLKDELSNRRGTDHVRPVGDANAASDPHLAEVKKTWNDKIYKKYLSIYNMDGKEAATKYLQQFTTKKLGDHKRATDAKIVEQRGGSEPADHLYRASVYEVQGDRARALDSYRAAASGFRRLASDATEQYIVTGETTSNGSKQSFFNSKVEADKESEKLKQLGWKNVKVSSANDAARKREAQARDGINACQTKFAQQYQHPGTGRVKVCDSASTALRTALERTRAGERVHVVDSKVIPGAAKARGKDTQQGLGYSDKSKCPTCAGVGERTTGNKCVTCGGTGKVKPIEAKDGAFAKLEGKLEKEGESKRKASGTDLINAHTWSVSELNSTLAELQRALKDARTPGKPQYGGNTRQIEEDIADAKRALASKSSAKDGAFAKLEGKLEKEGESKQEAGGVAYEAGAAKYGKAGMAAKSVAARDEVMPVGDGATVEGARNYEFAHGKPPKGEGTWLFSSKKGGPIEFEHRGMYTAAKAAAVKWANGKGLYEVWVLT